MDLVSATFALFVTKINKNDFANNFTGQCILLIAIIVHNICCLLFTFHLEFHTRNDLNIRIIISHSTGCDVW